MTLENLAKTKALRPELPDKREIHNLVTAAADRLQDAKNSSLSYASRFDLAYNAAYGLALSALRTSGYRSDKRYLVFQCLVHTTPLDKSVIRLFSLCHERRNLAEYEGHLEKDEQFLSELITATIKLMGCLPILKIGRGRKT